MSELLAKCRAWLKKRFFDLGILACEICGRTNYLSYAHRQKMRYVTTEEEMKFVALLCMSGPDWKGCHDKLEYGDKQVMYDTITAIREKRPL